MKFLQVLTISGWSTGEGWHATFDRLGRHLGFDWKNRPSTEQLTTAVTLLLAQREFTIEAIRVFSRLRKDEKRQGRRLPNAAERSLLEQRLALAHDHWKSHIGNSMT